MGSGFLALLTGVWVVIVGSIVTRGFPGIICSAFRLHTAAMRCKELHSSQFNIVSPFQGFSIFDCFFSINMSSLWDFGFCLCQISCTPPPPRPHPGPLHFLETERETLIIFSTNFIYSAFSWLESGEGGQRPDEVKCGVVGRVSSKISKERIKYPTRSKTKIMRFNIVSPFQGFSIFDCFFSINMSSLRDFGFCRCQISCTSSTRPSTKSKTKILIESQTNYHLPLTSHHLPFTFNF